MPVWLAIPLATAGGATALATIWRLLVKPIAELIVLQQRALPLLRDLTLTFATVPKPFDVLADIVKEFRTDGGSSLRDVVNRLEDAARGNSDAADILKVQAEASRQLADADRQAMARLAVVLELLTLKVDAADAQRDRMEEAAGYVAADLRASHERADAATGGAGEAADAASRSGS